MLLPLWEDKNLIETSTDQGNIIQKREGLNQQWVEKNRNDDHDDLNLYNGYQNITNKKNIS